MSKKSEKTVANLEHDLAHAGNALGKSEIALGVMSGAVIGSMAGIPGAVAGAIVGGAIGVAGAVATGREHESRAAEEADLDEKIGVSGGEMGAPNLDHPPPSRGTYSAAAAGSSASSDAAPAEGPQQPPED